jgi:hypothetical protein
MKIERAFAHQFSNPHGLLGAVAGRGMARNNGRFNTWVVDELARRQPGGDIKRIAEIGPGPGVALEAFLAAFPDAEVWGFERSHAMARMASRRNRAAVAAGRCRIVEGTGIPSGAGRFDLIAATHVVYFFKDPAAELAAIRSECSGHGYVALGYQLKQHVPRMSQVQFPELGYRLYDSDAEISALLAAAGFGGVAVTVCGDPASPRGRLAIAPAIPLD